MDIPESLSPPLPIVHCFRQVLRAASHIYTELLYRGLSWLLCLCSAMWRGPQEYITYELVSTSPAVSRMSGSSKFDSFCDGSNCLLIILVISSCVTFGFPSKFLKCCFHRCIHSCWSVAVSLGSAVLFLLLTSFIVCHAILACLSSTESLILSIWFCMKSVCSFRYMLANSFCAFLSFRAFVLVGFFLLHLEAVFTSARFYLTANVSYEILDLVLCLVGMYSGATSKWALTKFSICHSEYVFLSSPVVHRICFLMLSHIYL